MVDPSNLSAPDINVVFIGEGPIGTADERVMEAAAVADLVVALGNVNLEAVVQVLKPDQPALCVLGSRDAETAPPAPFRSLHGSGVVFKDWRVGGFSGGKRLAPGPGFYVSEEEAAALLEAMPACDILLTHAPPAQLPGVNPSFDPGFMALTHYLMEKAPIYHFYSHLGEDHRIDETPDTMVVGVSGILFPPALKFL